MSNQLSNHIKENHATSTGKYIKNIVFGGLDGIITTFSIIAASYGADFEIKLIIIMGVANLIADGISMGMGDFLSSYYENLYILSEKEKESYEYDNSYDYEVKEMIELYENEGIEKNDAKSIVSIIAKPKYKEFFLRKMVLMELDLEVPDKNFKKINAKEGLTTFFSFLGFGFIPIFSYLMFYAGNNINKNLIFGVTCIITALSMFLLGYTQAKLTKQNGLKYGFMMLINGSFASICAFSIGYGLEAAMN